MHCPARPSRRNGTGDGAFTALGRAFARRVREAGGPRWPCDVRDRPGRNGQGVAHPLGPRTAPARLQGLRSWRARGRRTAARDVTRSRLYGPGTARRPPPLPDGRRHAGRHPEGGRAGHRHVRLRPAHPRGASRDGLHPPRARQPEECPPRGRSTSVGRDLPLPGRVRLQSRLPAPPRPLERIAGGNAADLEQPQLLPATDGGSA